MPLDEVMLYAMGIASAVELRIVKNRGPLRAALSFPRLSLIHICHQDNVKSLKAEADASKKLAAQITELSHKENKSAADKALLKRCV